MDENKVPKVSVIVPVYNSEKYLPDTIESILNQTFADFELILIDDGSKDSSGVICDLYAAKDSRVRVIHKENGGICSARNAGLRIARGEYLAFCDNDDKYLPNLLKDNYELAKEHNADIVRFKRKRIAYVDGRKIVSTTPAYRFAVLQGEKIAENYLNISGMSITIWNGLYRKSILDQNKIRFPKWMRYGQEDAWFNYCCYENADCIVMNPNVYYYWIQRDGQSTTSKFHKNLLTSCYACMKKEWDIMDKLGVEQFHKDCYFRLIKQYLIRFYMYMNRTACTYNCFQQAQVLRYICEKFPNKDRLWCNDGKDVKLLQAILHNRGMQLYYLIKKMNVME